MITDQPTLTQNETSNYSGVQSSQRPKNNNAAVNLTLTQATNQAIAASEEKSVVTSVYLKDLRSGSVLVNHNTTAEHFGASIQKVPFAYLAIQDLRAKKIT